jgi:hypothetical protein
MGVFNIPLGTNVGDNLLLFSPFVQSEAGNDSFPPPSSERMITETGIYMITEVSLDNMITE